jgi:NADH dehydrogenase (ubiquinone) 1 alpha subcomplex subunit 5
MFRATRPLFNQIIRKTTTGITGLEVHPNPLPQLTKTYESTLTALSAFPATSVYRQGVEAITQRKLNIVKNANGDIEAVEKQLDEGHVEESLDIAQDELNLVNKMAEWKACVCMTFIYISLIDSSVYIDGNLWRRSLQQDSGSMLERSQPRRHHRDHALDHTMSRYSLELSHYACALPSSHAEVQINTDAKPA